jgi:hypothetical protein
MPITAKKPAQLKLSRVQIEAGKFICSCIMLRTRFLLNKRSLTSRTPANAQ